MAAHLRSVVAVGRNFSLLSLVLKRDLLRRTNIDSIIFPIKVCIAPCRNLFVTARKLNDLNEEDAETGETGKNKPIDGKLDRSTVIPPETSILYMQSQAYRETYGDDPIWKKYRRNHKGPIPPIKTRKTCIRGDKIATGNPCPVCRDEYLILDYRNTELLKQFIDPFTGETLKTSRTGLCRRQQFRLLVAMDKAKDHGYITFNVPVRKYDYSLYMPEKI